MIKLKYGNTNTFYIQGANGSLLFDTDYAGTLFPFYRAIKQNSIDLKAIQYVLASHYHPDHMGIIGNLIDHGVQLLLIDIQQNFIHLPDKVFLKNKIPFRPIDIVDATVVSCAKSRDFLYNIGIKGEIIHTPSHSGDSISLILDNGSCLVGDLEPIEYIEAYEGNNVLQADWNYVLSFDPKKIFYAHRPEKTVSKIF